MFSDEIINEATEVLRCNRKTQLNPRGSFNPPVDHFRIADDPGTKVRV
jgi:hypothetical protein